MAIVQNLKLSLKKLGLRGTLRLLADKRAKKQRLAKLLLTKPGTAKLVAFRASKSVRPSEEEISTITERADEMLGDDNYVFTFLHHLKNIPDVWNYDPLEKKYWQKKRYEETRVHSSDSPCDVKIVWEINRFKYLPLLAQAAYITKDKKYADEIESRILSWIEDNPFAGSINWSSPLEIAIRAISWAASLRILALAGFDISQNEKITQSIWQHAAYLNAELSTDKIVRSNHLVGETGGLYILSSFFDFPEAVFYKLRAKKIIADSILEQTYPDGGTRESSGWYHTFITDFADLALRTANSTGDTVDENFTGRFYQMSIYRNSIMLPDGDAVKFGDIDFGKAINLSANWKAIIFGENQFSSTLRKNYFDVTKHITAILGKNYLFARAGDFGWGGDGFSSHAHDDFLAPIVAVGGANVLVDPGTFAYNGLTETRDEERTAHCHNGLIITSPERQKDQIAELRPSFGWIKTRPAASIIKFEENENRIFAQATYGETISGHERSFTLEIDSFILEDHLHFNSDKSLEWNFHFHPRWRLEKVGASKFALSDFRDNHFEFELSGVDAELELLAYEFYPAYRQKSKAWKLRMLHDIHARDERKVTFTLRKI
jgi:hypothetical protein